MPVNAGRQRAAVEAVVAKVGSFKAGCDGAPLDDLHHGLRRARG